MAVDNAKIIDILNNIKNKLECNGVINVFFNEKEIPTIEIKIKNRCFGFYIKYYKDDIYNTKIYWNKNSSQYSTLIAFDKNVNIDDIEPVLGDKINDIINIINKYGAIKCSVVVPTYNREDLIVPLIEKLNTQTLDREQFEVIFVDDASKDNTVETIRRLSTGFNFRVIQRQVPSGNASAPRNEGIRVAYGDYVLFVDSDDYIAEYTLKDAIEYAELNNSDMVFLKLAGVNGRGVASRTYVGDNVGNASVFKDYLFNNFHPSKMVRTSVLRNNNILFDQSFTKEEDKLFVVTSVLFSKKISVLRDKEYIFIVGHDGDHLSRKREYNEFFRILKLWTYGISLIISCYDNNKKIHMYNAWFYRFIRAYYKYFIEGTYNNYLFEILKMFMKYKELFDIKYIYRDGKDKVLKVIDFYNQKTTMNDIQNVGDGEKKAHFFRNENEIRKGNRIVILRKDGSREEVSSFPKIDVEFKGGSGLVEVHESVKIKNKIKVFIGDGAFLHLDQQVSADTVSLNLSANDTTMWVGERSWLRTLRCICNAEPGMEIIMGKDIVMSLDVLFRPTDGHTIIDVQTGKPINMPKFGIHIGDHVWIGQSVTILKDAHIPQDCVIGAHSLVGRKDFLPNSIIAGIPAKTIKSGITWDKRRIHEYINSNN